MRQFSATFTLKGSTRIIDVGGTPFNWNLIPERPSVTLVNLAPPPPDQAIAPNHTFVSADGRELPFPDMAFDIAFSNSVIEHLPTLDDQERFSREFRRVAPNLWLQTPSRWFPIEPHLLTPFIHYLPRTQRRRFIRNFTVWGWLTRPSQEQIEAVSSAYRLLTFGEMRRLFPDCEIRRERFLGLTKSYIAVRVDALTSGHR